MTNKPIACINPVIRDDSRPLRIAILGATGSIGRQTADIIVKHPDRFVVTALSVNRNIGKAIELCQVLKPKVLVICDEECAAKAKKDLEVLGGTTQVMVGARYMSEIAAREDVDLVVTATVGYSGLLPTLAAIGAGKDIALANKETLVVAGEYIRHLLENSRSRIFPVDSEHSAIDQCLRGEDLDTVGRLLLTASGGPFLNVGKAELEKVTAADALRHPNWEMGAKITIDSATMMNKAFEIIEAHYLFGFEADRIDAVVHPQSIVHSMVEFTDGAIKAQLGVPDMHLPIAYALGLNHRIEGVSPALTLKQMSSLSFHQPDYDKFPCLGFAETAMTRKGNAACVINAANEIAVQSFLEGRIRFVDIPSIIERTLAKIDFVETPAPDDYIETNLASRRFAWELVSKTH